MNVLKTLNSLDIKPKKQYGQNFLKNSQIAEQIIKNFKINKNDPVIEIGPGLGLLTNCLITKLQEDQKLILIEKDPKLFQFLQNNLNKKNTLEWKNADVLETNYIKKNEPTKYQIISNLPFVVATKILQFFLLQSKNITILFFSFPEEIAKKILAKIGNKNYGFLTVFVQLFSNVKSKIILNADVFYPEPKIKSIFLEFIPKKTIINDDDIPDFIFFLKQCFKHKRKTLLNNWKINYQLNAEQIKKIITMLNKKNYKDKIRGEMCQLKDFKTFFYYFKKHQYQSVNSNKNKIQ